MGQLDIAVVGASSLAGETLLTLLAEREFTTGQVHALDDEAGGTVAFGHRELAVDDAAQFDFSQVRLVFLTCSAQRAAALAPRAQAAGCLVIDGSGHFSGEPQIPLVVPEVNPQALSGGLSAGLVASPAGAVIPLMLALKPLQDAAGIRRLSVLVCQAVSAYGRAAVEELGRQTADLLNFRSIEPRAFAQQIAFNLIPQSGGEEEQALVQQVRRLLQDPALAVQASVICAPLFYGHCLAVHLETREPLTLAQARALLATAPGVELAPEDGEGALPTAVSAASGSDAVHVSSLRQDLLNPHGLQLWLVTDNLRKGGALNCVQIAERLVGDYL